MQNNNVSLKSPFFTYQSSKPQESGEYIVCIIFEKFSNKDGGNGDIKDGASIGVELKVFLPKAPYNYYDLMSEDVVVKINDQLANLTNDIQNRYNRNGTLREEDGFRNLLENDFEIRIKNAEKISGLLNLDHSSYYNIISITPVKPQEETNTPKPF